MYRLLVTLLLAVLLVGCTGDTEGSIKTTTNEESTLNVAYMAQPPSLDPHITVAVATSEIGRTTFESLLSFNEKNEVAPLLAESFESSEDEKSITFHLRKGVKFHNGKEMTADDVVASMERWRSLNGKAKTYFSNSEFVKEDDYTVILKMDKPLTIAKYILAMNLNFAAIMPKEVIGSAEAAGVKEYIGTGPFQFVEWKQDQYIKFEKNEDYQSPSTEMDGLVGKREPLVNDLTFHLVPDVSTRTAGVQTGEYDIVLNIPTDNYEQLSKDPNLEVVLYPDGFTTAVFNNREGLFVDKKRRQAVNLAVKKEDVLLTAYTREEFYTLEHGLVGKDYVAWHNDTGKDVYDSYDPKAAKELLKETGYNGEIVRIITTRDYDDQYNTAIVVQQQLEEIGMKVELLVYDWPTLLDIREDETTYDIMIMNYNPVTDPTQINFLDSRTNYTGWTNDPKMDSLIDELLVAKNDAAAKEVFTQLQAEFWDYLPAIKFGDYSGVAVTHGSVTGFEHLHGAVLWNVSK